MSIMVILYRCYIYCVPLYEHLNLGKKAIVSAIEIAYKAIMADGLSDSQLSTLEPVVDSDEILSATDPLYKHNGPSQNTIQAKISYQKNEE